MPSMARKKSPQKKPASELAADALMLKRAWIISSIFAGQGQALLANPQLLDIPSYAGWALRQLRTEVDLLTEDFTESIKPLLLEWSKTTLRQKAEWFAEHWQGWWAGSKRGGGYLLGRLWEVQQFLGRLALPEGFDVPLYADVLLQGLTSPALRHPEYHLCTDIALLFNLLLDAEALNDADLSARKRHSTEHSQSLARSTILTCFNLLEAYCNGLTEEWIMTTPSATGEEIRKLRKNQGGVGDRINQIVARQTGGSGAIDFNKPPFERLFGECKQRRDSFVHCEPGDRATTRGNYVKEVRFHEATLGAAEATVTLTFALIETTWKMVHGRTGPSWLPKRDSTGRYGGVAVQLERK
jgi:hypothetical protein